MESGYRREKERHQKKHEQVGFPSWQRQGILRGRKGDGEEQSRGHGERWNRVG